MPLTSCVGKITFNETVVQRFLERFVYQMVTTILPSLREVRARFNPSAVRYEVTLTPTEKFGKIEK